MSVRSRFLVTAIFAFAASPGAGLHAQDACSWATGFGVSQDSIGPFPTSATVADVRQRCPQARDTTYFGLQGLVIDVPGGHVIRPGRRNIWYVTGAGTLPSGVSMSATWAELSSAYGSGQGNGEPPPDNWPEHISVWFDSLPGFFFFFENLDLSQIRYLSEFDPDIDLSSLPGDATIWRVMVRPASQ